MSLAILGGDISPNFASVIGESYATVQYNDRPDPFSHPGCWACKQQTEAALRLRATALASAHCRELKQALSDRSGHARDRQLHGSRPPPHRRGKYTLGPVVYHFCASTWALSVTCVFCLKRLLRFLLVVCQLILGLDMSIDETMDRIWPTITNSDALMINDAWAGHPGTLVKSYPSANASAELMLNQAACTGSADTTGWKLTNGKLQSPGGVYCLDGAQARRSGPTGQSTSGMVACPPPTTKCGHTPCPGCGSILVSCDAATGVWQLDETTGVLQWNLTAQETTEGKESGVTALPFRF